MTAVGFGGLYVSLHVINDICSSIFEIIASFGAAYFGSTCFQKRVVAPWACRINM